MNFCESHSDYDWTKKQKHSLECMKRFCQWLCYRFRATSEKLLQMIRKCKMMLHTGRYLYAFESVWMERSRVLETGYVQLKRWSETTCYEVEATMCVIPIKSKWRQMKKNGVLSVTQPLLLASLHRLTTCAFWVSFWSLLCYTRTCYSWRWIVFYRNYCEMWKNREMRSVTILCSFCQTEELAILNLRHRWQQHRSMHVVHRSNGKL